MGGKGPVGVLTRIENEIDFWVLEAFHISATQYSHHVWLLSSLNVSKSVLICTERMKYTGNFKVLEKQQKSKISH